MDSRWNKVGVSKEDFKHFKNAFDALSEFITKELKKKESIRDYSPGWEYKQIAVMEWNQALDDIQKILKD